jgi:hypothetical protein
MVRRRRRRRRAENARRIQSWGRNMSF